MAPERDWRDLNRAHWDERIPIHVAGDFYDVDAFLAGRSTLRPYEADELGDVEGCTLLHTQCHFGLDTLSWSRRGAQVTGLDFSAPAVDAARELARRAGLGAQFVHADVYDAVAAVGGRTFDIVYTGIGAINWLPDIERWAQTMADLVTPGGRFYMTEFHPVAAMFGDDPDPTIAESYFNRGPYVIDASGSYADPDAATTQDTFMVWQHTLGNVISALAAAGLRIAFLHEHPFDLRARYPFLERHADGTYWMMRGRPEVPLLYSVRASRPAARV